MTQRIRVLGIVITILGVVFAGAGVYAFTQVQAGNDSLQAFSGAQNVSLSYNEDGELVDRGTTEGADAILSLLVDEWGYGVNEGDLDPNDPVVNTATEYMFQMATIGYHVLHGTQTVVLTEATEYNGEAFPAGEYELFVRTVGERGELGGYWTDFDRMHPIEGPARAQAWSGTVHGLFGELGVGTVTASTLQLASGLSLLIFGLGLTFVLLGAGMIWIGAVKDDDATVVSDSTKPDTATT